MHFELRLPDDPGPVVVDVPHAGREVPPWAAPPLVLNEFERDEDADLFVDRIAARVPEAGAPLLLAKLSRFVIDLNRTDDDVDAASVEGAPPGRMAPRGTIWRFTTCDKHALSRPLTAGEYLRRVDEVWKPYRVQLGKLLFEARARHGVAVLLDAHSCPSQGKVGHADQGIRRADAILGWRHGTTCATWVIEAAERVLRDEGLQVVRDTPYRGGDLVGFFGEPGRGRHALQLELARRVYMDEKTLKPDEAAIERLQRVYVRLVRELAEAARQI